LSAIESGQRDLTLRTLNLLANALDISPGMLADGHVPPLSGLMGDLTREALERVAASVVSGRPLKNSTERELVNLITPLVQPRLDSQRARFRQHRGGRRQTRINWLMLRAHLPKALLNNLIERIDEQARSYDAQAH
jgi:transcriptional regulator with XRE-family HTH domain